MQRQVFDEVGLVQHSGRRPADDCREPPASESPACTKPLPAEPVSGMQSTRELMEDRVSTPTETTRALQMFKAAQILRTSKNPVAAAIAMTLFEYGQPRSCSRSRARRHRDHGSRRRVQRRETQRDGQGTLPAATTNCTSTLDLAFDGQVPACDNTRSSTLPRSRCAPGRALAPSE